MKCKKCGNKIVTMSGIVHLIPDSEPYESGVEEKLDIEIERHVIALYCEKCDRIIKVFRDGENGFE